MNADFIFTAMIQGIAFSGLGFGIYLSLRIFNIPDITTDGSYTLGGTIAALALSSSVHPVAAILLAICGGMAAGAGTGWIHTFLKVNPLLSGILMMTSLYSINLILLGRPNLPLIDTDSIFMILPGLSGQQGTMAALLIIVTMLGALLFFLLKTDFGIAMRATGNSEAMVRAMGINVNHMKITGLALANGCTACSGALIIQYQGFADINMGIGIVISGLGAVMIGETVFGRRIRHSLLFHLVAVVCGGLLFRLAIAGALAAGLDPNYLRLITALIVLAIVSAGSLRKNTIA